MSQDRVAFIPWNKSALGANYSYSTIDDFGTDVKKNQDNRDQTHHKRKWTAVYLDTPGQPLKKIGMGLGTRVHVQGHGDAGSDEIDPPAGSTSAPIKAAEVAAALEAQGLPKRYIGTIVCDICDSANGSPSFAKVLARELWKLGYKATCVMGYPGSVMSVYGGDDNAKQLTGKYTHRTVALGDGTEVKSKDAQIRFFGFT